MTDFRVEPCGSCQAPVIWCETRLDKAMPVDAEPAKGANLLLVPRVSRTPLVSVQPQHLAFGRTDLRMSHFVTCVNAAQHRKRRTA